MLQKMARASHGPGVGDALNAQSVGFVSVFERRTMVARAELGHFFGFPAVHEPRIKHHDGHENQQRALCSHPKIKRPTVDVDGQVACKKTSPTSNGFDVFSARQMACEFQACARIRKNPWRLLAQRHTDIQCLPLHAKRVHGKRRRAPKVSKQARGVALGPDILQGLNDRKRVAQVIAFEIRQFLQMQVVVRL